MNLSNNSIMLEVKNLNKNFGKVQAVKDVCFDVKKGEILGFLGPNGAGKTTTMRIITCFIPATSGTVKVCGFDTRENDIEVRKRIGYLPENNPLYLDMNVLEYLKFVGEIRGLKGAKLLSRIDEMLNVCGLTKMTGRQISKLSKGYKQRTGLAQTMLHDPEILILDEPMTGLDPNQIIEIRNLIKNIGKEKTVIYCSHILSEVSATCNRILIINNGSIVASGSPEELTSQITQTGGYVIKLKGDKTQIKEKLSLVEGVSNIRISEAGEWLEVFVVSGKEDIGEKLYKCIFENGWSLAELKRHSATLEDVFTQLTKG